MACNLKKEKPGWRVCYKPVLGFPGRKRGGSTAPRTWKGSVLTLAAADLQPKPPRTHPEVFLALLPVALGSGWYEEDPWHEGRKWACPGPHHLHRPHVSVQPTAQTVGGFSSSPSFGASSSLTFNKLLPHPKQMWEGSCTFSISNIFPSFLLFAQHLWVWELCSHWSSCWCLTSLGKVIIANND